MALHKQSFHWLGQSILRRPNLLLPVWQIFLKCFDYLSKGSFSFILTVCWLLFLPIGIGCKILRIDFIDRKIDKNAKTYWQTMSKNDNDPKQMLLTK